MQSGISYAEIVILILLPSIFDLMPDAYYLFATKKTG